MATSAIRYAGGEIYIRDNELGDWIQAITTQFQKYITNGQDIEWLLVACNDWCDVYENLPPGLKDIELDEVLDGEKRKEIFFDLLASVLSLPIGEGFDLEVAKKISLKIKEKLLHADE